MIPKFAEIVIHIEIDIIDTVKLTVMTKLEKLSMYMIKYSNSFQAQVSLTSFHGFFVGIQRGQT